MAVDRCWPRLAAVGCPAEPTYHGRPPGGSGVGDGLLRCRDVPGLRVRARRMTERLMSCPSPTDQRTRWPPTLSRRRRMPLVPRFIRANIQTRMVTAFLL